jgi:geranylgeranyl reductase family protein
LQDQGRTERREVVVAGGGPAGCATAILLRQAGHDVLLLEAARFPREKICGEGISPGAWRLLRLVGAEGSVRALDPHPLRGMRLTAPDGTSFLGSYGREREAGLGIRRLRFDQSLLEVARAAGVEVREATRVTGAVRDGPAMTGVRWVSGEGQGVVNARLVVVAEGRRSVLAREMGLLRPHPVLRRFAVRGHWEAVPGLGEWGEMCVGNQGYCGIAPLSKTTANVTFVVDQTQMQEAGGDLEGFYRTSIRRSWPAIAERLQTASLLAPPASIGPLALVARRVSAPGAVLVGDAAGFYDPFTGEGVTLALRTAELAASVCVSALSRPGAPDTSPYERARDEATRAKFLLNRLIQRIVTWPHLANAMARRLGRRPDLADRLVGIAGDLDPARSALGLGFLWDLVRA